MIMNDILGGGGFTSRIVNRVRSDEGLAYSAFSSFPGSVYFPYSFTAGFQSKSRTVAYATSIVVEEIKRIVAEPAGVDELENSKKGFIDRARLATKAHRRGWHRRTGPLRYERIVAKGGPADWR
jgi:predicted Zn-dependent peptidase